MQTICLIIPPSPFLLDERVFISLGILKVAAVLERSGWRVEMLDLSGVANYLDAVADHAAASEAPFYGITATTPQMPAAARIAETLRRVTPSARLILGGPHATLVHAAWRREEELGQLARAKRALSGLEHYFDVIVAGDGEEAVFAALAPDAPRIIDADGRHSPLFLKRGTLDALPFPARHLIDVGSYHYTIDGMNATSIIAQLGCPFNCGFCAGRLSPMLRHIRTRSSENIVEEMVHLYTTYGYTGFMFYDDELNVNKELVDLMQRIDGAQRDLGTEWRLRGFVKAELFTEEQAAAMYRAGFRWLLVGFESGSPRILDTIKKRATREDNTRCLEIAHRHGIKVKALMSIGHPGESRETVEETRAWIEETKPADFDVTIITPYPGSPYYDEALPGDVPGKWVYTADNGDRLYQEEIDYTQSADYYKGDPNDGYVSHVSTDFLSAEALIRERDALERNLRALLKIPFNPSAAALTYEHSMGQTVLPSRILRVSH
ncbi:MAG: Radical SAM domain protein [Parcubacteria bacterium C7867-001]|nr:MAG: Radical SAM domain protein [Parcubacteria bacterium C7867-001]